MRLQQLCPRMYKRDSPVAIASSRYLHQESNVDYFLDGMLSIRVLVAEAGEPAGPGSGLEGGRTGTDLVLLDIGRPPLE